MTLLIWLAAVVAVEAVTEIVVSSDMPLILWFRDKCARYNPMFLGKMFSCGYCMSVWIAAMVAWALPGHLTNYFVVDVIIKVFVLHRCSNVLHEAFSRWFKRLPFEFVLTKVEASQMSQPASTVSVSDSGDRNIELGQPHESEMTR